MTFKSNQLILMIAALALALGLFAGCDGHDDEDIVLSSAVLEILHLDTDKDGTPDTYQFRILIKDDLDDDLAADPPSVRLPDGSILTMTCVEDAGLVSCTTADQTPPGAGDKSNILSGAYQVFNDEEVLLTMIVDDADLNAADPAAADPASMNPASPGNLSDPAVLDWNTTATGVAGDYWEYEVVNADADDDDGEAVADRSLDFTGSDFSLDLPDTWDVADALEAVIVSVRIRERDGYILRLKVEVVITGYTLN